MMIGAGLLAGCGEPVGMRLEAVPAVACPGSEVELRWIGDSDARFTFIHADGRRERVKPDDARTVEASQVSAVRLSASATLRTSKTDAFDFQLVEARHTLPLRVNTTCGPVKTFEGGDGLTAQQTVALDPALTVSEFHIREWRSVISVEHAALRADLPVGQWLTTSFEGTPANGLWTFTSPLGENEACDPEDSALRYPPSGLSAELIVTCGM
ncbi:MAG TPA: hypothetical protein VK013_16255 [Myxococcaceae bacterium]|nr:hypothetical protein [Myxococcaceae bacterium]